MDAIYFLTVILICAVALWRWWRFGMTFGRVIDKIDKSFGEPTANAFRIAFAVLLLPAIVYFFSATVHLSLKYFMFPRCLPHEPFAERVVSCVLGDPTRFLVH